MKEKIYCGNAKTITTKYGDLTKLSFTAEDLKKLQDNLTKGWVNAVIKERREPSATGITHYLEIDQWEPEAVEVEEITEVEHIPDPEDGDELPF